MRLQKRIADAFLGCSQQRASRTFVALAALVHGAIGCAPLDGAEQAGSESDVALDGGLEDKALPASVTYQAEDRTGQSGCQKATNQQGYTGSGFMDFGGNGTWIEWNDIAAPAAGTYTLRIVYANGGSNPRAATIIVNGKAVGNRSFASTTSWNQWRTESISVSLRSGANTVRVQANTSAGGPNLDRMEVSATDLCPSDPNKVEPGECGCGVTEDSCTGDGLYEAEAFSARSGCNEASNYPGYTGAGFVDFGGNGTWIEWKNVEAQAAGTHELTFRYANASTGGRGASILVNGQSVARANFASTGSWSTWRTEKISAPLVAGSNSIRVLANSDAGGPNLDSLLVTRTSDENPNPCGGDPTGAWSSVRTGGVLRSGPMVGHTTDRSAQIWAYAGAGKRVEVMVQQQGNCAGRPFTVSMPPRSDRNYTSLAQLTGLQPATVYRYQVLVDGASAATGTFNTAPAEGKSGRFSYLLASCVSLPYSKVQPAWDAVVKQPRSFQLLHGDNVYADSTNYNVLWSEHMEQRGIGNYASVLRSAPTYATWDDHDFGPNNSNGTTPGKESSLRAFRDLWANPSYGTSTTPGVFHTFHWGDVQFFVLDNRYHRTPENANAPDNPNAHYLGDAQMDWLIRELGASKATFKIIVQGGLVYGGKEKWTNYSVELYRLFDFIGQRRISGVIFHGGDTHDLRFTRNTTHYNLAKKLGYPFTEIVSSGIGKVPARGWAMIDVDTTVSDPVLKVRFFEKEQLIENHEVRLSELTPAP